MTNPLERAAEAIAFSHPTISEADRQTFTWPDDWDEFDEAKIRAQARAALEALREPGEGALKAGGTKLAGIGGSARLQQEVAGEIFSTMIDAMLETKDDA
jgi:hypothetical protein